MTSIYTRMKSGRDIVSLWLCFRVFRFKIELRPRFPGQYCQDDEKKSIDLSVASERALVIKPLS